MNSDKKELIIRNAKIEDAESIVKCKNKISEYIVCEINNKVVGFLRFGKYWNYF